MVDANISIQLLLTTKLGELNKLILTTKPGEGNTSLIMTAKLDEGNTLITDLYSSDAIPSDEVKFKQYFSVFEVEYKQTVVAFQMGSTKSVKDIKFNLAVMEWLHKECIYIEADSISMNKMKVVGWFTKVYTHLVHHETMYDKIVGSLGQVSMTSDEILKLDASQQGNIQAAIESSDDFQLAIPKLELLPTKIGSGSGKSCVVTDVIGVKCAATNYPCLHEMLAQAANLELFHYQFVPPPLVFLPKSATKHSQP